MTTSRSGFRGPLALAVPGMLTVTAAVTLLASACHPSGSSSTPSARAEATPPPLRVAAAASLQDVVEALADAFVEHEGPPAIELNIAGSNTLARQIEAAPAADVFLSADRDWIDFLAQRGRLIDGSQRSLFENRLVLVARHDADAALSAIDDPTDLATVDFRHLALADPDAVPAGRYARQHLEAIAYGDATLWSAVEDRVVPSLDVRAALGLVRSDPAILGIVYRTDPRDAEEIRVVLDFEPPAGQTVGYIGAIVGDTDDPSSDATDGRRARAQRFLDFFDHPTATAIIEAHGFTAPAPAS